MTIGLILLLAIGASDPQDRTALTLARCLDDAATASTAGQTGCEAVAARDYDRRMNAAYATLMRRLPAVAGQRLREAQRAWLRFRDAETRATGAAYATRTGTLYVPMQAASATRIVRDRAVQLETTARVMSIDD